MTKTASYAAIGAFMLANALLPFAANAQTTGTGTGTTGTMDSTTTVTPGTSPGASPGIPNTGAGGDPLAAWVTLGLSGLVVLAGATYLVRTRPQGAR